MLPHHTFLEVYSRCAHSKRDAHWRKHVSRNVIVRQGKRKLFAHQRWPCQSIRLLNSQTDGNQVLLLCYGSLLEWNQAMLASVETILITGGTGKQPVLNATVSVSGIIPSPVAVMAESSSLTVSTSHSSHCPRPSQWPDSGDVSLYKKPPLLPLLETGFKWKWRESISLKLSKLWSGDRMWSIWVWVKDLGLANNMFCLLGHLIPRHNPVSHSVGATFQEPQHYVELAKHGARAIAKQ